MQVLFLKTYSSWHTKSYTALCVYLSKRRLRGGVRNDANVIKMELKLSQGVQHQRLGRYFHLILRGIHVSPNIIFWMRHIGRWKNGSLDVLLDDREANRLQPEAGSLIAVAHAARQTSKGILGTCRKQVQRQAELASKALLISWHF